MAKPRTLCPRHPSGVRLSSRPLRQPHLASQARGPVRGRDVTKHQSRGSVAQCRRACPMIALPVGAVRFPVGSSGPGDRRPCCCGTGQGNARAARRRTSGWVVMRARRRGRQRSVRPRPSKGIRRCLQSQGVDTFFQRGHRRDQVEGLGTTTPLYVPCESGRAESSVNIAVRVLPSGPDLAPRRMHVPARP